MNGYTALITGGNKGIGADLANRLLIQGYKVVSMSRNTPEATNKNLFPIEVDLLDDKAVKSAAKEVAKIHNVTHLIHNAGLIWPNLIEKTEANDISGLAQLHLGSALTLLKAVLPRMKKYRFGRVIFNGSRAALGVPTRTAYSSTKAGIIGMARTWALELAPYGITVNVVAPGPIQTDNFWGLIEKGSKQEKMLAKRIPVGRLGTPKDISNAFLFFCDPQNSFVTGQTLYICGGASIGGMSL